MQKFLTLIVFSIFVITANAQFQKGNKVLGAGLNFQTSGTKETSQTFTNFESNSISLSLEMGFAKEANRLNGFYINSWYGKSKYEYSSQPSSNYSSENFGGGAGFFTKKYKSLGKGFFVYGEARGGFNYYKQNKSSNSNGDMLQYGVNIGVYPGLAYKWSDRFMLDLRFADFASVGYSVRENGFTSGGKNVERNFSLSSSLGLGYLSNFGIGARFIIK
ncbi:MAG: hypothetical protein QM725_16465 [Lacibacter sp.]